MLTLKAHLFMEKTLENICHRRRWFHWICSSSPCYRSWSFCREFDALTYAACLDNVSSVADNPNYFFECADIRNQNNLVYL